MCSTDKNLDTGFIQHIEENKNSISIYLINEEETNRFNKYYFEHDEDIFDINGKFIDDYAIQNNNKLFGYYHIKNNFEEEFFTYIILEEENISIGEYIDKIKKQKMETGMILSCILDSNGSKLFKEFTSRNLGRNLAIVFDNKIIVVARIMEILENSITFKIDY
jgi:preprotein translocase subunit SecD